MMKNISIIALSLSSLLLNESRVQGSDATNEAQQRQIKKIILDNLPSHTFHSKKGGIFESGDEINEVRLASKDLTDQEIRDLVEELITDPEREKLQILRLENNKIGTSGAIGLASVLDYLKGLEELDISNNPIGLLGFQAIFIKASTLKNLKSVRFSSNSEELDELRKLEGVMIEGSDNKYKASFKKLNK